MQTLLIVSKGKKPVDEYVASLCKDNKISNLDIQLNSFEKAVGIEDVRNMQKGLFLKPFSSPIKLVILEAYLGITTEAQNALLKVLEEPPANTLIAIMILNKEEMLPTIISRCKIINLSDKKQTLSEDEITQYLNILVSLYQGDVGYKLKLAQDIARNKDTAPLWLEKIILAAREELLERILNAKPEEKSLLSKQINNLRLLTKTHTLLKATNTNPRLALENIFLSFS